LSADAVDAVLELVAAVVPELVLGLVVVVVLVLLGEVDEVAAAAVTGDGAPTLLRLTASTGSAIAAAGLER
jgi:hypothetical protein